MPHHPINLDLAGPVNDNSRAAAMSHRVGGGREGKRSEPPMAHKASHSPQATGLPGALGIIHDVRGHGSPQHGIPGIIQTTTTSPENRARLVSGIIDRVSEGHHAMGPVCEVMGHDATAYNTGMVHLRGSPFSSHHKAGHKADLKAKGRVTGGANPGHA
jgi:hypothetical protein